MIKRIFSNWWFVSIATIVIFALLFLVALPSVLGIFRTLWVRIAIGVGLALFWLIWFFLRRRKAKKSEEEIAEALVVPDRAGEEAQELKQRMKQALAKLRESSGGGRNYLYSRPWYVIIGPPGAGKTTALMNSGLRFPFSDQSLQGSGGTRNLDFLFANEAVLVDTAGRYTTQDSDVNVDSSGWNSLLHLLRKQRPFEPVNAIFVAIPIDELQAGDVHKIDEHAATVRARLYEIRSELQTNLPIYLILTKSDLLAGFVEYFDDLDVDGRRAVLGQTFSIDQTMNSDVVTKAFDKLTNHISARQPKRLQEEIDQKRRGLILGFPAQLHSLRAPLHRFIEGAFLTENREMGSFRGFYFSSGMQDGTTLDRILDSVSTSQAQDYGGTPRAGRAFFLNRFLTEVVFPEAGLPVPDAGLVRKRKNKMRGIMAGMSVIAAMLTISWGLSFSGNRTFQKDSILAANAVSDQMSASRLDLTQVGENDASLEQILPLLNELRNMPEGYGPHYDGGPALFRRFGLFQSGLSRRNKQAYHNGLRRILLPRIMLDLEDKIERNLDNPVELFEPLKIYLLLGGAGPEGQVDAKSIRNYIERGWALETFPGSEMRPVRDDLSLHLEALTNDRNLFASWPNRRAPLDADLIDDARLSVRQLSLAELAFAIMRENASNLEGDWYADSILQKNDAKAFANPDKVMNLSVPYFFTADGFKKSYSVRLVTAGDGLKDELWVLDESADNPSVKREMGNLRTGISLAYTTEYIAQWEKVVKALEPGDFFNNPQSYRAFKKAPSPIKKILSEVRSNTTFGGGAAEAVGEIAMRRVKRNRAAKMASQVAGASSNKGLSADAQITNHFRDLNAWVGDGVEPAEIDDFVDVISESMEQVIIARSPGSIGGPNALATAMAPLQKLAIEVPELASGFVQQVAQGGSKTQLAAMQKELSEVYEREVLPLCQSAISNRYPFDRRSSQDASLREIRSAFGNGGRVVSFIDQKLSSALNRSGSYWSWQRDPVTERFSNGTAYELRKAFLLHEALVDGLPLDIALVSASAGIDRVELSTGGANLMFENEGADEHSIVWRLDGGVIRATDLRVFGSGEIIFQDKDRGSWSLFRVLDKAKVRHTGKDSVRLTFSQGGETFVFALSFPESQNPFTGSGLWSLKCSPKL